MLSYFTNQSLQLSPHAIIATAAATIATAVAMFAKAIATVAEWMLFRLVLVQRAMQLLQADPAPHGAEPDFTQRYVAAPSRTRSEAPQRGR